MSGDQTLSALQGGEGGERSEPGEVGGLCALGFRVSSRSDASHLTPTHSSREEWENSCVFAHVTGAISTQDFSSELRAQASASCTSRMPAASVWWNGALATTWGMKPSQPKR